MLNKELISRRYINDNISIMPLNDVQLEYKHKFINDSRIKKKHLEICPLCGYADQVEIAQKDRYGFELSTAVCERCGLVFSVFPYDSDSTKIFYSEYYREIYDGNTEKEDMVDIDYKYRSKGRIEKFLKPDGIVVEIGTGGGWNLLKYKSAGYLHYGFDYNHNYINYGKDNYGLNLIVGGVKKAKEMGIKADYVILSQVLEHMTDPLTFLLELREILNKSAYIKITVPSLDYMAFGGGATGYDLLGALQNAHNILFDDVTLRYMAIKAGYVVKCLIGGYMILQNGDIADNVSIAFDDKLNRDPRGKKIIKYLRLCERFVPIKKVLFSKRMDINLHVFYWLCHPLKSMKAFVVAHYSPPLKT